MDLRSELDRLVSSEIWKNSENLPPSDPAFHFFDVSYVMKTPRLFRKSPSPMTDRITDEDVQMARMESSEEEEVDKLASVEKCGQNLGSSDDVSMQDIQDEANATHTTQRKVQMGEKAIDNSDMQAQTGEHTDSQPKIVEQSGRMNDIDNEMASADSSTNPPQLMDEDANSDEDESGDTHADEATANILGPTPVRQSTRIQTKIQNEIPLYQAAAKSSGTSQGAANRPKRRSKLKNVAGPQPDVIDVDLWIPKPVTLNVTPKPTKIEGKMICAYGPTGDTMEFCPVAHDAETLEIIEKIWTQVENAYDQKPLHLSHPERSGFFVLSEEKSEAMSPEDWLSILKTQNVVITGRRTQEPSFKRALQNLGTLNTVMTIQDQSISAHDNYNKRCLHGTFSQVLEASQSPEGKVLNALDIGVPAWGLQQTGYASSVSALMATRGEWRTRKSMPMEEVNWALAATSGAFHTWHIDCNGFMTFVSPVCGAKLWIIGRPHVNVDSGDFTQINIFFERCKLNQANEELWTLEAMLLKPGDTLIMRPNTPHTVYTPTPTVAHGGHCYSSSTLQSSLVGMVHAFMAGSLVTNTNHLSARFHLQQMIAFFHLALVHNGLEDDDHRKAHVPDCRSPSGFENLMAICMFGILINVLDFATYRYPGNADEKGKLSMTQQDEMKRFDINGLTEEERMGCMFTWGQALQIMDTVAQKFKIDHEDDLKRWKNLQAYQQHIVVSQCQMLYNYKFKATKAGISGAPGCNMDLLKAQLSGVLIGDINVKITSSLKDTSDCEMRLPKLQSLTAVNTPLKATPTLIGDPLTVGISIRDRLYLDNRQVKSEVEDKIIGSPPRKQQKS